MKNDYIDLRVHGDESTLIEFARLCGKIQYAGDVGSCKTVRLTIDGDGSGRQKFACLEQDEVLPIPSQPFEDHTTYWIGE